MNSVVAPSPATENRPAHARLEYAGLAVRWLLGGLFVYMGLQKALHPELFLKLLRQYDLTDNFLMLNLIAAALPWFEIFCGLILIAGIAVRGTALLILSMLAPFTFVVLKRALAISSIQHIALCAVRFDCGCGGGEVLICRKMVENVLLMLLSGWLLAGFGRRLAARFSLLGPPDLAR